MGLLDACREYFDTKNLYEVLGITKCSSAKEIKKAYHKLSLKVHPDRASSERKQASTQQFQTLSQVYFILSDENKKTVYDETGEIDDESDIPRDRDWNEYWRLLFPKVTVQDIKEYEEKYKHSAEERDDLKKLYEKFEGDFDEISDNMVCYSIEDEPRLRDMLDEMINDDEVPAYNAFVKEPPKKKKKRSQRYRSEAAEAEEHSKELGLDVSGSLQDVILRKNRTREAVFSNLMSSLEDKYCKPKPASKSKPKARRKK